MVLDLWKKLRERRVANRLDAMLGARVRVVEATGRGALFPFFPARLLDLSETGCRLALPCFDVNGFHLQACVKCGDDYLLEIEIASPLGGTWVMLAEAAWATRDGDSGEHPCRLGARFTGAVALPRNWRRILCQPLGQA